MTNVVLVQPSVYGTDNSCLLDALAAFNGQAVGVCVIDPDNITSQRAQQYHAAGVRGIRVRLTNGATPAEIATLVVKNAAIARRCNWVLELCLPMQTWTYLHEVIPQLGVPVVVEHFAHAQVGSRTGDEALTLDPFRQQGFAPFLELLRNGQVYVKLSAPYRNSRSSPAYGDMRLLAQTFIGAGPDFVLFGSDWPHTTGREGNAASGGRLMPQHYRTVNDAGLLAVVRSWCGSETQFRKILVHNPARLWRR